MIKTEDINKMSHTLIDIEIRLKSIDIQIKQIERELAMLNSVEANLEENIRILKRKRVIVTASDYKKSITDLATCRTRKSFLNMDLDTCLKAKKHSITVYEKLKEEYEKAYDLLHNPPNNVVHVNFRRKNGQ